MAASTEERERLRARIAELLRKVPASVAGGSVQTTRNFKKFYADAQKKLAAPRTSQSALEQLYETVEGMYR